MRPRAIRKRAKRLCIAFHGIHLDQLLSPNEFFYIDFSFDTMASDIRIKCLINVDDDSREWSMPLHIEYLRAISSQNGYLRSEDVVDFR